MKKTFQFSAEERAAVYRAINERRDIRHFVPFELEEKVLWRLLHAAHAAPSVGFMQPWDFIVIRDEAQRRSIRDHVAAEKEKAGRHYTGERAGLYRSLKIEGILECSAVVVMTCDPERGGEVNFGRVTMPQAAQFSVCAAIQNFWLAARAEGLGVGWVSVVDPDWIKARLGIPEGIDLVALLCVGMAKDFPKEPLLQTSGWRQRESMENLVHSERWDAPYLWAREPSEIKP